MTIVYLNNKLTYFSQKSPYLSMSACPYVSICRYKKTSRISPFNWTSFNVFDITEFKLNILTAILSGATERRRKLETLEISNQRENEK